MSKAPVQARVYELKQGRWIEHGAASPPSGGWRTFAGVIAGAIAIAVMAAITILAAALTAIIVPVALILSWLAARRRAA